MPGLQSVGREGDERVKSTHKVEVVRVKPQRHPNADKLLVVPVYGYNCCIGIADWEDVPRDADGYLLAAYVPPDSVVDATRPEFAFLRTRPIFDKEGNLIGVHEDDTIKEVRTKAKRLRGVVSYGFLLPAPPGTKEGEDLAEALGVTHYEPPLEQDKTAKRFSVGGEAAPGPNVYHVKYDVDALRRYPHVLKQGEPTFRSEKVDGSNGRFVFHDGKMYCGSREEWKREFPSTEHVTVEGLVQRGMDEAKAKKVVEHLRSQPVRKNLWWYALERCPALEKFCRDHPDHVVYGEVFGRQGKLKYTDKPDEVFFAAFDIMREGRWTDAQDVRDLLDRCQVPQAPFLGVEPYDFGEVALLAEGDSMWPGARCIREGVVVKPLQERWDREVGRVNLKVVSAAYSEKFR